MKSIKNEKNLRNKKVLLRLDLNVPLDDGKISDTTRIDKIIPTLKLLNKQKTKIIILSHVGRPNGKVLKEFSYGQLVLSLKFLKDNHAYLTYPIYLDMLKNQFLQCFLYNLIILLQNTFQKEHFQINIISFLYLF